MLLKRRTLDDVLGRNDRDVPVPYVADHDPENCAECRNSTGDHIVVFAEDGVIFDHRCPAREGGRIGLPDHFGAGMGQCPICGHATH